MTDAKATATPKGFIAKFAVLLGAVRELWIVFAVVLFSNLAYRVVNFTLRLWLSSDLGYSDCRAGSWWCPLVRRADTLHGAGRVADRRARPAQGLLLGFACASFRAAS